MTALEQAMLSNELERPKSSQGVFELPCGYLDSEGTLHKEVELSELTGNEEELLVSPSVPAHRRPGLMIGRCLKRVGTIVDRGKLMVIADQLTVGDRMFILFALRRITLGDEYPFKATCRACSKEGMYSVNLGELEVRPMKEPHRRVYDVTLPSGKTVRFRIMTGEDEGRLARHKKLEEKISVALAARIELLNGAMPTLDDIKKLTLRDRDDLRALMDEHDGGVDTSIEMQCTSCGAEFEEEVDVSQAGFFFPSMVRRKSKTKSIS